ncbi:MAG: hydroxymethylglutaryl-CoA synthase family protein [Methylobacteriaceae bacterium]|nr:hydroxymethylglutaryl-CoA synthase family protein [Methylobacteriaceae bacterium]
MTRGILAFGGYIPMRRLSRAAIAQANGWFNSALKSRAKGERAMANWDEDSVTMAVAAARDSLSDRNRDDIAALHFASTSFPFLDRLNAGIVAGALNLKSDIAAHDHAATQRAGTSALSLALDAADAGPQLVVAADKRQTKAAGTLEMHVGDGAAALLVGTGDVIAELVGKATRTVDFVDHFRADGFAYDYPWEERWIRDEGYQKIVAETLASLLKETGIAAADISAFCMPCTLPRVAAALAKKAGMPDAAVQDNMSATCGETGAAHPLLMLSRALENAKPGDLIVVAGFGQGSDALAFRATDRIGAFKPKLGVKGHLARRREEKNYNKYLSFNELVTMERGMRSEVDKAIALSALYRKRDMLTGFIGGRCSVCGTVQFPKSNICVNPNCNASHTQEDQPFADLDGKIMSYTADELTYTPDPPACYGMVQFEVGGRIMMDFTDIDPGQLDVGRDMDMVFRVKDRDPQRGFTRYFWKAAPAGGIGDGG